MKYLILSDRIEYGGAEVYVHNLIRILKEHGQDVLMLYFFDEQTVGAECRGTFRYMKTTSIEQKLGRFISLPLLRRRLHKLVEAYAPDVVILNSESSFTPTVMSAVKGKNIVKIVHDHRMICHTGRCADGEYRLCDGYRTGDCYGSCGKEFSTLHIYLKLMALKKTEKLGKKWIDLNIAPSQALTDKLLAYGYPAVCINNPMDVNETTESAVDVHGGTSENVLTKKIPGTKNDLLYVGRINRDKGIVKFGRQFLTYREEHTCDRKLKIYGNIEKDVEQEFAQICKDPSIEYMGVIAHENVVDVMRDAHAVVVPSLWVENYPTVILEAMAAGIPVLGANRGGIPEMLSGQRGILYDPLDDMDTFGALDKLFSMDEEGYGKIVQNGAEYLREHNLYEVYWKHFSNALESIMTTEKQMEKTDAV